MKILKIDQKEGRIRLVAQNPDDLWHIQKVLEEGDLLTSKTYRKASIKRGSEIDSGERRPMTLTIRVEKHVFDEGSGNLRVTGKIREGPEDVQINSYHTIEVVMEEPIVIGKKWKKYQIERLKDAERRQPKLLICVLDRDEAHLAMLKESGIEKGIVIRYKKVWGSDDRTEYYGEILKKLEAQKCDRIIIAGPGFERENLHNFIKGKNMLIYDKVVIEHANETGETGIQEVLKRSANKVLRDTRIAKETEFVERLFAEMNMDGMVVYGVKETEKAMDYNAIERLMVSDSKAREFEGWMDRVEDSKGEVIIISSEHEAGERFLNLGGIGGFLRFRVE